jgi:hypothetical protein
MNCQDDRREGGEGAIFRLLARIFNKDGSLKGRGYTSKRGTMFRLLPGIFDIVPLQGEKSTVRSDCATGRQLPAGAWSHLRALRQGAEALLRIGVFSQTIRL